MALGGLARRMAALRASRLRARPGKISTPQSGRIIFLIGGAAFVAASVLAATGALVWQLREQAFSDAAANVEKIDLVLAEQTSRTLQSIDLVVADILHDIHAHDFDTSAHFRERMGTYEIYQQLRKRISGMPQLEALVLVDADGDIFNLTRNFPAPEVNVLDRDYYNALRDNPKLVRVLSAPVLNRMTGGWTFYLARRVNAPDGSFIGVVAAAVALDHFERFFEQIYFGNNTAVSLWRTDGTLLARYPHAAGMTGRPDPTLARNNLRVVGGEAGQAGSGRIVGIINPMPILLTVRRVPGYALFTNITVPEDVILASWRRTSAFIVAGGIIVSIAIGVIAWLLMKQFGAHQLTVEARTQRDEATATLKQVEAVSRAKSDFLAHMSHELRTPLNAIIGFAELMKQELMGPIGSPQYKTYAGDIHASGLNLLGIVNDVLDFSQANAGRLTVDRHPVELSAVIRSIESMFRVQVRKAGVDLSADIEAGLPPVLGDEKRIKQVLTNLIGNAIKFTPEGGSISVTARSAGDRVILRVADTGIGIPAENLAKLFEPFGQVNLPLLAQKNRGAGLGLPISKQLVELLGGTLTLESELNSGTVITVDLQAAASPDIGYAIAAE